MNHGPDDSQTKKKRKSDPGSFRPISLLCNLGKVLEFIVTTRLYLWAESINLLPSEQSRFRKKRSVNDRLFQLTQIVAQQFAKRRTQRLGAIFLDVEKAFDRVWHNDLRFNPIMGGGGYFMYVTWGGGGSGKFAVPHFSVPTHAETMKFGTIVCNQ